MLGDTHRLIYICLDLLPSTELGWTMSRRIPRWIWVHIPLQFSQQLPGRLISTPGSFSVGSQDLHSIILGCGSGAFHRADVREAWLPVGQFATRFHSLGMLRYSVLVLFQGRYNQEEE